MRTAVCLFFVFLSGALRGGNGGEEHVHLKIIVPKVIKHHIHHRTVYVHVPKPKRWKVPKKKKEPPPSYHREEHHEDWSSWRDYSYERYEDDRDNGVQRDNPDVKGYRERGHRSRYRIRPINRPKATRQQRPLKVQDTLAYKRLLDHLRTYHGDGSGGRNTEDSSKMVGYSHPPQYAIRENVDEVPENGLAPQVETYEEGYRTGHHALTGGLYTGETMKFHENAEEESDHADGGHENEEEEEEEEEKDGRTHTGRYLVDEEEWENAQNDNGGREGNRRHSNGI